MENTKFMPIIGKKTFSKFIQTARSTMTNCLDCSRETEQWQGFITWTARNYNVYNISNPDRNKKE